MIKIFRHKGLAKFFHDGTKKGIQPEHAEKLMLYGQFVGSWDVHSRKFKPDGRRTERRGEWHFAWVLGGRGVQDVLFETGVPPHQYGTTLRCYDATDTAMSCSGAAAPAYYVANPDTTAGRRDVRIGNPDFSSRSLRGNAVLRWEYRPGSTLFLVWTTSCSAFSGDPRFSAGNDVQQLCQGPSANVFAVKMNYWLSL
mgnify:CR=1 FL=1